MFNNKSMQYKNGRLIINPITECLKKPFIESNDVYNTESNILYFYRFKENMPNAKRGCGEETYKRNNIIYFNNDGDKYVIVEYRNCKDILIYFFENNYYVRVPLANIKTGQIKNPYHLNKYGCYIGEGKYDRYHTPYVYYVWFGMQERCAIVPEYTNVYICDEWKNLQNFGVYLENKLIGLNKDIKYNIDKDFLQIGNPIKIYSPTTCMIIPEELNLKLIGLYRSKHKISNLPTGVVMSGNKTHDIYAAQVAINHKSTTIYKSDDPMVCFQMYRNYKLDDIRSCATYYFSVNALSAQDYNYIMNKFDILPYNN